MKTKSLLAASLLCLAGLSASAQQDGAAREAWFKHLGIERSGNDFVYAGQALTVEQLRTMDELAEALTAAPDAEAALARIDKQELDAEGRDPASPSTFGSVWFAQTPDGWRLTEEGRRAVPGIVLKTSVAAASAGPVQKPINLAVSSSRIDALAADPTKVNFDGTTAAKALPDAPKPQHTAVEKDLFWSTFAAYHATFAADFTTTGMVIGRGGYETDHLYTQFGNKNAAGVIGSAVALHVAASAASWELYRKAAKTHGIKRVILDTAAIGINAYGIGAHTQGAAHNAGLLKNWNSR